MSSKNIITLTDATFEEEVLKSDLPVLVDFWAAWCGPCKMIAPFMEELADEMAGKVKIAKLNVDENTEYAAKFAIRSIPTLILFKDGEQLDMTIGGDPNKIRGMVDRV